MVKKNIKTALNFSKLKAQRLATKELTKYKGNMCPCGNAYIELFREDKELFGGKDRFYYSDIGIEVPKHLDNKMNIHAFASQSVDLHEEVLNEWLKAMNSKGYLKNKIVKVWID